MQLIRFIARPSSSVASTPDKKPYLGESALVANTRKVLYMELKQLDMEALLERAELEGVDPAIFPGDNIVLEGPRQKVLTRARQGAFDVFLSTLPWDTFQERCKNNRPPKTRLSWNGKHVFILPPHVRGVACCVS